MIPPTLLRACLPGGSCSVRRPERGHHLLHRPADDAAGQGHPRARPRQPRLPSRPLGEHFLRDFFGFEDRVSARCRCEEDEDPTRGRGRCARIFPAGGSSLRRGTLCVTSTPQLLPQDGQKENCLSFLNPHSIQNLNTWLLMFVSTSINSSF